MVVALLVALVAPALPAAAATGDQYWDDRFGLPGLYDADIETLASGPNGVLYAAGSFRQAGGVTFNHIARWDGRRWQALGAGVSGAGERIEQVAVAPNGSVYVVGDFTGAGGASVKGIARWDGTTWSAVGNGIGPQRVESYGTVDARIHAVTVGADGVYIGGDFTHIDGVAANGIARWDGQNWHALGRGVGKYNWEDEFEPTGVVYSIVAAGGGIYVGGKFDIAGQVDALSVAAWDGVSWSALGAGISNGDQYDPAGTVEALAFGNGRLYAGGFFTLAGGKAARNIAAWGNGAWSALGSGVDADYASDPLVNTMLVVGNDLYAGGDFTRAGGQTLPGLARWNGSAWSAAGPAPEAYYTIEITGLVAAPTGGIYVSGNFYRAGGMELNGVAQLNGGAWRALGQGVVKVGDVAAEVRATAIDATGRVYIGGTLSMAGGVPVKSLAMWDGNAWSNVGGGVDGGEVYALQVVGDDVYVAGTFTKAGNIAAAHIAKWNRPTGKWTALGSGINGGVYALAYADGILYAGGGFTAAGGTAAFDVAAWNGANWSALGGGYRVYERSQEGGEIGTTVYALAVSGPSLFIGGSFQTIQRGQNTTDLSSFVLVNNVVEWRRDTQQWLALGIGNEEPGLHFNGSSGYSIDVRALAVVGSSLYAGGRFNMAGGATPAASLARWDMVNYGWKPIEGVGGLNDSQVNALASYGGELFVGGAFTAAGPAEARYVARYKPATNTWSTLGSGARWYNDQYTSVLSIAVGGNGVFMGGQFNRAGEQMSFSFARWSGPLGGTQPPPPAGKYRVYLPVTKR